jgi:hypothetical protein
MTSGDSKSIQLLQGTLDLIVLRTLASMGSQHAYQIANRLEQSLTIFSISIRVRSIRRCCVWSNTDGSREPGEKRKTTRKLNTTQLPGLAKRPLAKRPSDGEGWLVWLRSFWLRSLKYETSETHFLQIF